MTNKRIEHQRNKSNIINIQGIECYEQDGVAYLELEAVARGLGFTTVAASGNEVVRWNTVHKYLSDLSVATSCNGSNYRECCPDFIPENIFYRLAMKAKNEAAEAFQAKVADEIIPSIRKHGMYAVDALLDNPDFAIQTFQRLKEERDKRLALEQQAEMDKPKVLFADAVSASDTSILIGELAKILKQNGIETGQQRLFEWLRENGYLMKTGSSRNMPTQRSMELGLFEVVERTIAEPNGSIRITKTTKVSGKGQQYFISLFLNEMEAV